MINTLALLCFTCLMSWSGLADVAALDPQEIMVSANGPDFFKYSLLANLATDKVTVVSCDEEGVKMEVRSVTVKPFQDRKIVVLEYVTPPNTPPLRVLPGSTGCTLRPWSASGVAGKDFFANFQLTRCAHYKLKTIDENPFAEYEFGQVCLNGKPMESEKFSSKVLNGQEATFGWCGDYPAVCSLKPAK